MRRRGTFQRTAANREANFPGQHFLCDGRMIAAIIDAAALLPTDTVIDIGAGRGAISLPLTAKVQRVIAIERDQHLIGHLEKVRMDHPNLQVVHQDFLRYCLPRQPFCVVSSIPFAITTPILSRILDPRTHFERGALLVEKGAARRFTATPVVNPVILTWRTWFRIDASRTVPRTCFSPQPRVDSVVLCVRRIQDPVVQPNFCARFLHFAAYGLQHPETTLRDTWHPVLTGPQMARAFRAIGAERDALVRSLTVPQWGLLFNLLAEHLQHSQWMKMQR